MASITKYDETHEGKHFLWQQTLKRDSLKSATKPPVFNDCFSIDGARVSLDDFRVAYSADSMRLSQAIIDALGTLTLATVRELVAGFSPFNKAVFDREYQFYQKIARKKMIIPAEHEETFELESHAVALSKVQDNRIRILRSL